LPTPALVREEIGEAFAPREIFGVAALVLQVDGVRRSAWSAKTELAVPLFETYPRGDAPLPEIAADACSYKLIDVTAPTETRRCSSCTIRPGFAPCAVCVGNGGGSDTNTFAVCDACAGEGFLRCSTCGGTTHVVACSIRYVNDAPVRIRRVIMPAVHAAIRPFVEARIHADAGWSDAHAFDPEPSLVASAYRGASAVRNPEDFHGFFFGDALGECYSARSEATTGLARFAARTYAIPVLWTVTGDEHAAYFYDESDVLQRV
jgi:hypothetical protein